MADQSPESEAPRWLLEPWPGEALIHVAVGEGATLTPELRAALDALADALSREEVAGYAKPEPCPELNMCSTAAPCEPRVSMPCAKLVSCRIAD